MLTVLVLICPPLAVLLTATPSRAAANLGLTLLLYVPGVVHAWATVDRYAAHRQYESLMRALERNGANPSRQAA